VVHDVAGDPGDVIGDEGGLGFGHGGREGGGRTRSRPRNKLSPSPALYSIKSFLFPVVDNENILSLYTTFFLFWPSFTLSIL
jgi:hypothetical protein